MVNRQANRWTISRSTIWGTENHNSRKKFGKDRNTGFRNDEITRPKLRVIGHDSQYHKNFLTSSYYVFIYNGVIVIDLSGVQLGLKSQVWKKRCTLWLHLFSCLFELAQFDHFTCNTGVWSLLKIYWCSCRFVKKPKRERFKSHFAGMQNRKRCDQSKAKNNAIRW